MKDKKGWFITKNRLLLFFLFNIGDLNQYSVFQPDGTHIFELSDEQTNKVHSIYERMFEEINSGYIHKYDF